MPSLAKSYAHRKYTFCIIDTLYSIALLLIFLGSGLSLFLEDFLKSFGLPHFLLIIVYLLVISFFYYLLNLPLNFYTSFTLEHKFNLSKQGAGAW